MKRKFWLSPENAIYVVIWLLFFLLPIITTYLRTFTVAQATFHWHEVWHIWRWFSIFLVCFLLHNFLIAPQLLKKRRVAYFGLVIVLLGFFLFLTSLIHGPRPNGVHPPRWNMEEERVETPKGKKFTTPPFRRLDDHRPAPFGPVILVNILLLVGVLGLNLGVKFYFKSEQDRNHLQQLEKERMYLQLQYLKFQINPHFFMNTLNNIQVLIDMDAEKAKIRLSEIIYIEGMSEYLKIHLDGKDDRGLPQRPVISLYSLKRLEERLPAYFMRIHRSYIINLRHIKEVSKTLVMLDNDMLLPIGDLYKDKLNDYLGKNYIGK